MGKILQQFRKDYPQIRFLKSDATISHFSNWWGHECFKTFLTIKIYSKINTELPGNISHTIGKTVFKASCCALPEILVRTEKPLDKTKKNNKVAQPRFNRAETIFLLTEDITGRVNHPPLGGHGFLAMGSITGPILHLKNFACTMLHPGQWKKAAACSRLLKLVYSFLTHFFSPLSSFVSCQPLFTPCYRLQGSASPFPLTGFWG